MAPSERTANQLDDLTSRFREIARVGEGSEGGTFVAVDRGNGRKVTLKPLRTGDPASVRAVRVLRDVGSPHLPAIADVWHGETATWLATAWVEGRPLTAGPVPPAVALGEALGVAHALAEIHRAGTHHGDVSPGNVIVTPTHGVVLVDLGQVGVRGVGTPGFLAPEVLAGGGGPSADWFSLGCLLCWRLFGTSPWLRPEAVIATRSRTDVRHRLADLVAEVADRHPVTEETLGLLERLLDPRATARPSGGRGVVDRLAQLHAAARSDVGLRPKPAWWVPARWPFRGNLAPILERLRGPNRPRLVVVSGPVGSGRARVVEEVILGLAAAGVEARLTDPDGLRSRASAAGTWIDGWVATEPGAPVIGLPRVPSGEDSSWLGAALAAAVSVAGATLVVPVPVETGQVLRGLDDVEVVEVRPWDGQDVMRLVSEVHDGETGPWVDAVMSATGGWPGRVIRSLEGSAAAGLEYPDPVAIGRSMASGATTLVDPELAVRVLLAAWGDEAARRGLPAHVHDGGGRPLTWAVAQARRCLRDDLSALAQEHIRSIPTAPSAWACLDAGRWDKVEEALVSGQLDLQEDPVVPWLLAALRDVPNAAVSPAARERLASFLLASADAGGALEVVSSIAADSGCDLQAARALQRLGHAAEACQRLDGILSRPPGPVHDRARGLRWRVLVDLGRGEQVLQEARTWVASHPDGDSSGLAEAYLWAAYGALLASEEPLAESWLQVAAAHADACAEEAPGVTARVRQVRANLATAGGDLLGAQQEYHLAAKAFARAGESVGELGVAASLANIAVSTGETVDGLRFGRAALRGFLGRGDVQRLPETGSALVQLLARAGRLEEAEATATTVSAMVGTGEGTVGAARAARMVADVMAARLARGELVAEEVAGHYGRAARRLVEAGASREGADAWLRAAEIARSGGDLPRARTCLEEARSSLDDADAATTVRAELEMLSQATAARDADAARSAVRLVLDLADPVDLARRGQFDLLLAHDRALLPALQMLLPAGHAARRTVAERLRHNLEVLMSKTTSFDTTAARAALTADGQDPDSLRAILDEIDGNGPEGPARAPARPQEGGGLARLLRMYRRLAREEDLGRVLEQVVDAMMDLTDAERGAVVVRSNGGAAMEVTRELAAGSDGFRFSRSVIERVFGSGEPVLSVDAAEDDRFDESRSISHLNLRSVLAVPLRFRGQVVGAAYVDHRLRRGNFDEADLAHMEEFADLAALAVAHAQALESVRRQAVALEAGRSELTMLLEQRDAEVIGLREEVRSAGPHREEYRGMVGSTEPMQRVFRLIDRVADTDVPVVIHGESGTGKELVARAIHDAGRGSAGPFVAENCGAIPETLLEGVLFGHARGAFTGADRAHPGLFEAADGGTIFLDEVSEMSAAMQIKLLRVLQEGEVRRVGENVPRTVNVRVIAASNRDLDGMAESGEFRRDLYYRINVVQLRLPALRERKQDLPDLVRHFLRRYAKGREIEVGASAFRILSGYEWPGNVRELENEVRRWVALAGDRVGPGDLSDAILGAGEDAPDPDDLRLKPRLERVERQLIDRALERTEGNQTRAAELLGVSRYGLQKKLRRLQGNAQ